MKRCITNIIVNMLADLLVVTMIIFTVIIIWNTVSVMLAAKGIWWTGIIISGSFFCLTVALVSVKDLLLDIALENEE